jgi:hypothetical protein
MSNTLRGAGSCSGGQTKGRARFLLFRRPSRAQRLHDLGYGQIQLEWLRYIEGKVFRFGTKGQQLESSRDAREMQGKHINTISKYEARIVKQHNGFRNRFPWPHVQCDLAILE